MLATRRGRLDCFQQTGSIDRGCSPPKVICPLKGDTPFTPGVLLGGCHQGSHLLALKAAAGGVQKEAIMAVAQEHVPKTAFGIRKQRLQPAVCPSCSILRHTHMVTTPPLLFRWFFLQYVLLLSRLELICPSLCSNSCQVLVWKV